MSEKKDKKKHVKNSDYLLNNQSIKSNDVADLLNVSQKASRLILNDMVKIIYYLAKFVLNHASIF